MKYQSTRRWDDDLGVTTEMRSKEDAHDYRYFPEPDLLPIQTGSIIEKMRPLVPELPHQKAAAFRRGVQGQRVRRQRPLQRQTARRLLREAPQKRSGAPKKVANWVINNLLGTLNDAGVAIADCPIAPEKITALVDLVGSGQISNNQAKEVFADLYENPDQEPADIATAKGFEPADNSEIEGFLDEAIAANPDKIEEIKAGNDKLINWLTGQVMKASKGKANPKSVGELIREKLGL